MPTIPRKPTDFFPASFFAMQALFTTEQVVSNKGFTNYSFIISSRTNYFNGLSVELKKFYWPFTQLYQDKAVLLYRLVEPEGIYHLWQLMLLQVKRVVSAAILSATGINPGP